MKGHWKQSQPRPCPHVGGLGLVQCSVHPSWLITLMRPWPKWGTLGNIRLWYSPTFAQHHLRFSLVTQPKVWLTHQTFGEWLLYLCHPFSEFAKNVKTGRNQVTNYARPWDAERFSDGGNNFLYRVGVTMKSFSQLLMVQVWTLAMANLHYFGSWANQICQFYLNTP